MSEEVSIQIVDPGAEDDPFSPGAGDPLASPDGGITIVEDGTAPQDAAQPAADESEVDDTGAAATAEADPLAYTDEELVALEELQSWVNEQNEQQRQLQSRYDRQIAAQNRQIRELANASAARENELLTAIREAKLNGLSAEEQDRLKQQWAYDDEKAKLDAYGTQLSDYHVELLRTAYATDYAEFGLLPEDLEQFNTPEEMEQFVKDVQIEYYRLMADPAVQAELSQAAQQDSAPAAAQPAARRAAPAGASAPTDAGGGGAPPPASKFNTGTGVGAMADNIRMGWETTRAR